MTPASGWPPRPATPSAARWPTSSSTTPVRRRIWSARSTPSGPSSQLRSGPDWPPLQVCLGSADRPAVTVRQVIESDAPPKEEGRPVERSRLRRALLPYAVSRLLTILVAVVVGIARPGVSPVHFLAEWDGYPFLDVVRNGYPATIPHSGGHALYTN